MIIVRSPLRISFAGGGTDLPSFYRNFAPGVVLSTAINRHVYITLNEKFEGDVSVRYRIHEHVGSVREIRHPLIRECLLAYGVENGIELVVASDVPARGSGLGASSALACALCFALEKMTGHGPDFDPGFAFGWSGRSMKERIAARASKIEIERCGSPIGKQDHYASAVGGFNLIQFNPDETVDITKYNPPFKDELEAGSMLFYLAIDREYKNGSFVQRILKDQISGMQDFQDTYILQAENAIDMFESPTIDEFMKFLQFNWHLKKTTHEKISSEEIDWIIASASDMGALAAKVCGAGGGGFLYLFVPSGNKNDVRSELSKIREMHFGFDSLGVQCVYWDERMLDGNA